jgi:hypothetical protein
MQVVQPIIFKGMGRLNLLTRYLGFFYIKLISENTIDWDEYLSTMLVSYQIA